MRQQQFCQGVAAIRTQLQIQFQLQLQLRASNILWLQKIGRLFSQSFQPYNAGHYIFSYCQNTSERLVILFPCQRSAIVQSLYFCPYLCHTDKSSNQFSLHSWPYRVGKLDTNRLDHNYTPLHHRLDLVRHHTSKISTAGSCYKRPLYVMSTNHFNRIKVGLGLPNYKQYAVLHASKL